MRSDIIVCASGSAIASANFKEQLVETDSWICGGERRPSRFRMPIRSQKCYGQRKTKKFDFNSSNVAAVTKLRQLSGTINTQNAIGAAELYCEELPSWQSRRAQKWAMCILSVSV